MENNSRVLLRDQLVRAYESKDFMRAEAVALQLKKEGDHSVDLDYSLGLIYHQTGRSAEAVEFLTKAHAGESKNFIYSWALAEAAKASGRVEIAIAAYRDALEIDEKSFDLHLNLFSKV